MLRRRFADPLVAVTACLGMVLMLLTYLSGPAEAVTFSIKGVAVDRVAGGAGLVVKIRYSCQKGFSAFLRVDVSQRLGRFNTNSFSDNATPTCKGREHA